MPIPSSVAVTWSAQRVLLFGAIFAATIVAGGWLSQATQFSREESTIEKNGNLVSIGTHALYMDCQGLGSPTLVIENGLGGSSIQARRLQVRLSKDRQVCIYDRAGIGFSDMGPNDHSAGSASKELEALLNANGIRGQIILAGHSYGGIVAMKYAEDHPQRVAGLVLLDSSHPDQWTRLPAKLVAEEKGGWPSGWIQKLKVYVGIRRLFPPQTSPYLSADDARAVVHFANSTKHVDGVNREWEQWDTSVQQAKAGHLRAEVPMLVVTAGKTSLPEWDQLQLDLAGMSTKSQRIVIADVGHGDIILKPEAVETIATKVNEMIASLPALP